MMLLNLSQMQAITRGAVRVEEQDGRFRLLRFTEAQANYYSDIGNTDFYNKTFSTAGVRLAFRTDSTRFSFDFIRFNGGSSRYFADFDLYENAHMTAHRAFDIEEAKQGRVTFTLSEGEKLVEVYLPFSVYIELYNVELDDGATLQGAYRKHTLLAYGDSITHGYDARYPSLSYANALARLLDADIINKGIGGEGFCPGLLATREDIEPDYITAAYGTNDWSHRKKEDLIALATAFYRRLSESYPDAKIFAVSPICRLRHSGPSVCGGSCKDVDGMIRSCVAGLPNVTVLNGWRYIPELPEFFSDRHLHPNDIGFTLYAQNLYRDMVEYL